MYKIGYFLILLTVLIPVSVGYVMHGGMAAGWLLLLGQYTEHTVVWYRICMALLQIGTFAGCVLFFNSYAPQKNHELLALLGTALYVLSPIWFYVCYDLVNLALAFFLLCIPYAGWGLLKGWKEAKYGKMAKAGGYFAVSVLGVAAATVAVVLDPVKTEFAILREKYYINDMFSAFIYRTAHPGLGLGLLLAVGLFGWLVFVQRQRLTKREVVIGILTLLGMIAAGCSQSFTYGPLFFMMEAMICLILLVTGRDYTVDGKESTGCRLMIYGTIAACLAVGTFICNMLMYYRAPLN